MNSEEDICSLQQVSVPDLYERSLGKILYKISIRALVARSLYAVFLARSLNKISKS